MKKKTVLIIVSSVSPAEIPSAMSNVLVGYDARLLAEGKYTDHLI